MLQQDFNFNWELDDEGPPFCFSCEMIFPDHKSFHGHSCPVAGYICSCGTEFSKYVDMLNHNGLHEPGHTVMNYNNVKRQQNQRGREQAAQLELNTSQGSWAVPGLSVRLLGPKRQTMTSAFDPGATITDLWHQFQPVVVIETLRTFGRIKPYRCAYCELGFATKDLLIWHHNTHIRNKVHGCLQCGVLLLSNNKSPRPNQHRCSSLQATPETRFTTATVLSNRKQPAVYAKKVVQNQPCPDLFSSELQLGMHMLSQQPQWENPVPGSSGRNDLICRVCQDSFQTVKLLERHRCTKAASFFAQKLGPASSKQFNGYRKLEGKSPYAFTQRNGDKELAFNIQTSRKVTVYHKSVGPSRGTGMSVVSAKTEQDSDDDCFVIESSSTKPSQQIYISLTSVPHESLPINREQVTDMGSKMSFHRRVIDKETESTLSAPDINPPEPLHALTTDKQVSETITKEVKTCQNMPPVKEKRRRKKKKKCQIRSKPEEVVDESRETMAQPGTPVPDVSAESEQSHSLVIQSVFPTTPHSQPVQNLKQSSASSASFLSSQPPAPPTLSGRQSSQTPPKKAVATSLQPFRSCVIPSQNLSPLVMKLNSLDRKSDPRKYLCPRCGRLFRHTGRLRAHMLTHVGSQSYTCDCCGKTLESWKSLWLHQRVHRQKLGRFSCPKCQQGFRFVGPYKQHILREHPEYQWVDERPKKSPRAYPFLYCISRVVLLRLPSILLMLLTAAECNGFTVDERLPQDFSFMPPVYEHVPYASATITLVCC
ncbi:hypothetical protein DPEC_G00145040 [Dallia pectoralis]|uniref:Uncharacterized protein n=1 Tax=Dallia pectoralis TaxID=75939 RepID=A0ACC2GPD2_DALPE|nr:hypothetical protein DPEC_G00145040 [Dallia pectoralis]